MNDSSMLALVYTAPKHVQMEERARPAARDGESLVEVEFAGICGSDMSGFLGHSARRLPPLILGHELVGRLADGRRVVANPLISCGVCGYCLAGKQNLCASWRLLGMDETQGAFAQFVSLPSSQIHGVPDSLTPQAAILVEPLANIVHLFRLVSPQPFFRLAIVGAGTMGALALLIARQLGVRETLVVDVNLQRLETMRQLGATHTDHAGSPGPSAPSIRPADFDLVIDASGISAARQLAFSLCRPGGQVALLGMMTQSSEIDFVSSIRKEHRVTMSFAYTPADFERALALLVEGAVDLSPWTSVLALERGQEAFDRMTEAPGSLLKMMLEIPAH